MVRKSADSDDDVSLFPFLSVIACIIGTLTMIIAAQAVSQLDNEIVNTVEDSEKTEKELASIKEQLSKLNVEYDVKKKSIDDLNKEEEERLSKIRKHLLALTAQLEKIKNEKTKIEIVELPKIDLVKQREDLVGLKKQLKSIQEQIAQLEKELYERKSPPEASHVSILPTGTGVNYTPYFVECDVNRIIVHISPENYTVRVPKIWSHPKYKKLLKKIRNESKATLVFLIRDDGLDTYYAVRNQANKLGVNNGKIPVIGQGNIDLKYFTKNKK